MASPKSQVSQCSDDEKAWEEAAAVLSAPVDLLSVAVSETPAQTEPSSITPIMAPVTQASASPPDAKRVSWEPGMLFRTLKTKVESHEFVKKMDNLFRPIEAEQNTSKSPAKSVLPFYDQAVDWKNKNRDESKKKTLNIHSKYHNVENTESETHSFVANVRVSDVSLTSLPAFAKRSPYIMFSLEGRPNSTFRASSKGPFDFSGWECDWDIRDVWADLSLSVFAAKAGSEVLALEDVFLGKAFIPLSSVVASSKEPYIRTLTASKGSFYELSVTLNLLPVAAHAKTYARCVEGLPSTGMPRPAENTGQVRLRIQIRTRVSLAKAMLFTPPIRRSVLPSKGEELNPALLQQRKMRIKNIKAQYVTVFEILLEGILSWRRPFATWVWLTLFAQITLFSPPYQWPFFIALCAVLGAYFVHVERNLMGSQQSPIIYSDETTMDPDLPQTIPAKVKALKELAEGVQMILGIAANILERIYYALSWDDPYMSFMLSVAILIGSFATSFLLMIVYEGAIFFRVLVFAAGLFLHVPGSLQDTVRAKISRALRRIREAKDRSTLSSVRRHESVEDLLKHDGANTAYDLADASFIHSLPSKDQVRGALSNLLKRIPDGLEIDHRRIAKQRQVETSLS